MTACPPFGGDDDNLERIIDSELDEKKRKRNQANDKRRVKVDTCDYTPEDRRLNNSEEDTLLDVLQGTWTIPKPVAQKGSSANDTLLNVVRDDMAERLIAHRRKDKKVLLYSTESKLIVVNGELAKHYTEALNSLGFKINLPEYSLDKGGYSPEAAKILGDDYVDDYIIIATPAQRRAGLERINYNFLNKLADKCFEQADLMIQDISLKEALVGKIKNPLLTEGIEAYILKNEGRIHDIELGCSFDTPNKSIEKIKALIEEAYRLKNDSDLLLSKDFLNNLEKARALKAVYGNLTKLRLQDSNVAIRTNSVKLSNKDMDLYALFNSIPVFVFFNKKDQKTIVKDEYIIINGFDTEKLIDTLYDFKIIDYSFGMAEDRMKEIAVGNCETQKGNLAEEMASLSGNQDYPKIWHQLKEAVSGLKDARNEAAYFKSLPAEVKMEMFVFRRNDDINMFNEMMSKSQSGNILRMYMHDESEFRNKFSKAAGGEQESLLKDLCNSMMYDHQNNLNVNKWLKDSYPAVCEKQE